MGKSEKAITKILVANKIVSKEDIDAARVLCRTSARNLKEVLIEDFGLPEIEYLKALAQALETRDISTRGHCERVAKYATALARRMGFDSTGIEEIQNAALLHDIGKIGIRDDILLKTQKLTPEEEAEIRSHPIYGDKILSSLKFLGKVALTVKYHHERWDGAGYPSGLTGAQIPLASRILAVCDAFDTITSDRPYRPARTPEEAVKELKTASGQQFDPEVVDKLLVMVGIE